MQAALKGLFHGVLTPGDIVCVARLALDAWEEDLAQQQLQGSTAQSAPAPQLAPRHLLTAMRTHAGLDNLVCVCSGAHAVCFRDSNKCREQSGSRLLG
jgi:hypothetical protein